MRNKILGNLDTLYIYLYDTSQNDTQHIVLLEYSKNVKVARCIVDYLFMDDDDFDFQDCYNHFINKMFSALSPDVQLLIPTNVKDFGELLEFSREYKINKLEVLLNAKQSQFVQNVFE